MNELVVEGNFSRREERALPTTQAVTPMQMIALAVQQGADIAKLEKLMELQERWEKNEARKEFDEAMAAAKAEIPVILKNRAVDFTTAKGRTHYFYEDFAEVARTVDPVLAKNGLSYRFRTSSNSNEPVTVVCVIAHRRGHSEETTLSAGRDESGNKNSIQAIGSTLTYLQRMTLKAALGLSASADDDGRSATSHAPEPDPEGKKTLEACASLASLQDAWKALTPEQRKTLGAVKDACKETIQKADAEAAK